MNIYSGKKIFLFQHCAILWQPKQTKTVGSSPPGPQRPSPLQRPAHAPHPLSSVRDETGRRPRGPLFSLLSPVHKQTASCFLAFVSVCVWYQMSRLGAWAWRGGVITGGPICPQTDWSFDFLHYLQLLTMFSPSLSLNLFIHKMGTIIMSLHGYFEDNVCKTLDTKQWSSFATFFFQFLRGAVSDSGMAHSKCQFPFVYSSRCQDNYTVCVFFAWYLFIH